MFIVINNFDKKFPYIVSEEDGMPILFGTRKAAEEAAEEEQQAIVVEL